jgi:hypothetical protein
MGARPVLLRLLLILGGMLLIGCSSAAPNVGEADALAAEETLSSFLGMLAHGEYTEASALYAGPLDSLQVWNPEIDAQDVAGLIGYGCGNHLLQCLPVRTIQLADVAPPGELVFNVEFSFPDGALFVRGPCCGASSTEMPDQSNFAFRVQPKADGGFVVLDLPPYVP